MEGGHGEAEDAVPAVRPACIVSTRLRRIQHTCIRHGGRSFSPWSLFVFMMS